METNKKLSFEKQEFVCEQRTIHLVSTKYDGTAGNVLIVTGDKTIIHTPFLYEVYLCENGYEVFRFERYSEKGEIIYSTDVNGLKADLHCVIEKMKVDKPLYILATNDVFDNVREATKDIEVTMIKIRDLNKLEGCSLFEMQGRAKAIVEEISKEDCKDLFITEVLKRASDELILLNQ